MNPKGNFAFHTGYLFIVGAGALATPRRIGTLQEVSFSFKGTNKSLTGEMQFAEAVGRSDVKITGKAKTGKFSADAFNDIFFSQQVEAGHKAVVYDEERTIDNNTFTVAAGANIAQDLGVAYKLTGVQLTRVASSPAAGQYTVNMATGAYSFHESDEDKAVLVTYVRTVSDAGKTIPIVNMLAGEAPTFQGIFFNKFQGKSIYLKLNALVSDSLDFGFKSGDFAMPDFGFEAQADANGNVGEYSQSEA